MVIPKEVTGVLSFVPVPPCGYRTFYRVRIVPLVK